MGSRSGCSADSPAIVLLAAQQGGRFCGYQMVVAIGSKTISPIAEHTKWEGRPESSNLNGWTATPYGSGL
jgi:hypothetical protein